MSTGSGAMQVTINLKESPISGGAEAEASAETCRAFGDRKKRDQMVEGTGEPEVKRGVSDEGHSSSLID